MNLLLILSFLFGSSPVSQGGSVAFVEEYLEFKLQGDAFTVNGLYLFVNHSELPVMKQITYPFPVSVRNIDSVSVFNTNTGHFMDLTKVEKGILFTTDIPSGDTLRLNIFYRQRGITDSVHYILTTTKNWGSPLHRAEYTFEADGGREVRDFSYPPDKSARHGNNTRYYWKRSNFMPDRDFIVRMKKN
jgi:hypothetical protein